MSRVAHRRAPLLAAAALSAVLAVSGCSGSGNAAAGDDAALQEPIVDVIVGELSNHDGRVEVGDDITVLVNLPADEWTVTNGDPGVVEIEEEEAGEDTFVVRLIGSSPGESLVTFEATKTGEQDEITVVVG